MQTNTYFPAFRVGFQRFSQLGIKPPDGITNFRLAVAGTPYAKFVAGAKKADYD